MRYASPTSSNGPIIAETNAKLRIGEQQRNKGIQRQGVGSFSRVDIGSDCDFSNSGTVGIISNPRAIQI